MTEKDLIELGFSRTDVTAEESGADAFYFYEYHFTKYFSLISCENNEAMINGWYVEFFEHENIKFDNTEDLKQLIELINRAKV